MPKSEAGEMERGAGGFGCASSVGVKIIEIPVPASAVHFSMRAAGKFFGRRQGGFMEREVDSRTCSQEPVAFGADPAPFGRNPAGFL